VASAWERARLRRLVQTVPGIARVIDHGVAVQDVHISDEELRTVVDATLRSVGNTEARGLTIDVHGAIATLRGVAGSREVAVRVCNAIRRIPGIRRAYDATLGPP
jgi:osmotically-inducible protein OsmY